MRRACSIVDDEEIAACGLYDARLMVAHAGAPCEV